MKNRVLIILTALAVTVGCIGCGKTAETDNKSKETETTKVYHIGTDGETPGYSQLNKENELDTKPILIPSKSL